MGRKKWVRTSGFISISLYYIIQKNIAVAKFKLQWMFRRPKIHLVIYIAKPTYLFSKLVKTLFERVLEG